MAREPAPPFPPPKHHEPLFSGETTRPKTSLVIFGALIPFAAVGLATTIVLVGEALSLSAPSAVPPLPHVRCSVPGECQVCVPDKGADTLGNRIAYSMGTEPSLWRSDSFVASRGGELFIWIANGQNSIEVAPVRGDLITGNAWKPDDTEKAAIWDAWQALRRHQSEDAIRALADRVAP